MSTSENTNSQYISDKVLHLKMSQGNANFNMNNFFPVTWREIFK